MRLFWRSKGAAKERIYCPLRARDVPLGECGDCGWYGRRDMPEADPTSPCKAPFAALQLNGVAIATRAERRR